jgi:hypothetical protein
MKTIYSFLAVLFFSVSLSGQTTKEELFENPNKTGGVYYAYPDKDIHPQTPAPTGYEPFYISHFGRHGSRYLINDSDYKDVLDILKSAKNSNALTPLGLDVYNRLTKVWEEAENRGGELSPLDVKQHRNIAERMFAAYPEIFKDSARISARSTTVIRCILSMSAFCERLKELNPALQITQEASERYMYYLNKPTQAAMEFRSDSNVWKRYYAFEEAHLQPQRLIRSLFSDESFIGKNIKPTAFMWALYWIASDMQDIETPVSFYDVFEKEELFNLWQSNNYKMYVGYANAAENGGIMMNNAKPLLKNIIRTADTIIVKHGKGATLRFAHDVNIIPLAMLLHLQNCYNSVSDPADYYKAWSDFKVAPMAANIQMIFFRKNDNPDDVIVKFLLNENEVLVPPLQSDIKPFYRWKDVKNYYNSLLNN